MEPWAARWDPKVKYSQMHAAPSAGGRFGELKALTPRHRLRLDDTRLIWGSSHKVVDPPMESLASGCWLASQSLVPAVPAERCTRPPCTHRVLQSSVFISQLWGRDTKWVQLEPIHVPVFSQFSVCVWLALMYTH